MHILRESSLDSSQYNTPNPKRKSKLSKLTVGRLDRPHMYQALLKEILWCSDSSVQIHTWARHRPWMAVPNTALCASDTTGTPCVSHGKKLRGVGLVTEALAGT